MKCSENLTRFKYIVFYIILQTYPKIHIEKQESTSRKNNLALNLLKPIGLIVV